jgi:aryl-alcohol dehydrogenase-like predicted oxidoreductase
MSANSNRASIPRRPYGPSGIELSVVGLGGVLLMDETQDEANRRVAEAFERGVNYFDVAPSYKDAEIRMGPALEPYRDRVFLACKTTERTAAGARAELERSLERLRTDHFDLYQLHSITDVEADVDVAMGKGGALEVVLEAQRAGKVRHIGFSAHSEAAALAALDRFDFDSALFPINFASWHAGGFGPQIMQRCIEKNVTRLALKSMALQRWPDEDPRREQFPKSWYEPVTDRRTAALALRWTLSQPVTAAIPPGVAETFGWALEIAAELRPLSAEEEGELMGMAERVSPVFPLGAGD